MKKAKYIRELDPGGLIMDVKVAELQKVDPKQAHDLGLVMN